MAYHHGFVVACSQKRRPEHAHAGFFVSENGYRLYFPPVATHVLCRGIALDSFDDHFAMEDTATIFGELDCSFYEIHIAFLGGADGRFWSGIS